MYTEDKLNELLCTPSQDLIDDIAKIKGDIMILGAGGKMGPTLCLLCKNAIEKAGINKRVIAVSRFTDEFAVKLMSDNNIETISADLQDYDSLNNLPEVENIIFMAGLKFGTYGNEWKTWGMNAVVPSFVARKFKNSNIVVFSSGNIYPPVALTSGGCTEEHPVAPTGEYAMSALARERIFEYAAHTYKTKIFVYRLNFAVDLRYGVLCDIAEKLITNKPISLQNACFNFIWQGSANEIAIRGLLHASSDVCVMNVTGPETVSVKHAAQKLGKLLNRTPVFEGEEGEKAYLNNAQKSIKTFGYPEFCADELIDMQAEWFLNGGRLLNKHTHFEETGGKY